MGHQGPLHLPRPDGQEAGARTQLGLLQQEAAGKPPGPVNFNILNIFNAKQGRGQELMVEDHQTQAETGQAQQPEEPGGAPEPGLFATLP